jgi:hypothetical protein
VSEFYGQSAKSFRHASMAAQAEISSAKFRQENCATGKRSPFLQFAMGTFCASAEQLEMPTNF